MNILYIADVSNWALGRNGQALKKYGKHNYTIRYGRNDRYRTAFNNAKKFDLIVFSVDVRPDVLIKAKLPRKKTVMLIRSDIYKTCKPRRLVYYKESSLMKKHVGAFMVANNYLLALFKKKYDIPCYYAPGGVDTQIFKPPEKMIYQKVPRIGWAGSKKNFGIKARGIDIIQTACRKLGYKWRPAYREVRWRTQHEMVNYYYNETDVYIDLWSHAGRQNGLLEAGACGLPLVSCEKGIARELSNSGGLIITPRSIDSVCYAIKEAVDNKEEYGRLNAEFIKEHWGWDKHTQEWEAIFERIRG